MYQINHTGEINDATLAAVGMSRQKEVYVVNTNQDGYEYDICICHMAIGNNCSITIRPKNFRLVHIMAWVDTFEDVNILINTLHKIIKT